MTLAPADILCPCCGYDLRAIGSERCPECGWDIDRTGLAASQIPWTFRGRGTLGRWRAYLRTMPLGAWRIKRLASEVARPVALRDARRFATVTAIAAALPFAIFCIAAIVAEGGTRFLNPLIEGPPAHSASDSLLPPAADAQVPYAAGMTRWPVLPAAIVLFVWLCTRMPPLWFRSAAKKGTAAGSLAESGASGSSSPSPSPSAELRERAAALSYYTAAAPLPLLWLSIAWFLAALGVMHMNIPFAREQWFEIVTVVGGMLLAVAAFIVWWINVLRLLRRTINARMPQLMWTAVALPATWNACAMIAFLVFPWVMGYLWLMIESVRG
jgi:hypothetical protein